MSPSRFKLLKRTVCCHSLIVGAVLYSVITTAYAGSAWSSQTNFCITVSTDTLFVNVKLGIGQDSVQCITVTNCGDTTEVLNALTGMSDYSVSPKISPPLEPDSSFTFCVTFAPKNIGDKNAFLFINIGSLQKYISMRGSTPCANLSVPPIMFGIVPVGKTSITPLTITNNGDYYWKPSYAVFSPDNGVFSIMNPGYDTIPIPPNQSVQLNILYQPKARSEDSAILSFPNAGPCGNDLQIPVSGIGGCAHLTEQLYSRPLTGIGGRSMFTIILSNSGNIDWNPGIGKIIGVDSAVFKLISIMPPIDSAGKQSVLTVEFSPDSAKDAKAEVIFPDSGPCSTFNSLVSLLGEGACDDFFADAIGTQSAVIGQRKRFLIRITAAGPLGWKPGIPIISGPDSSAFSVISVMPDSVMAGGSVNVTLEFAPMMNQLYSATLTFPSASPCLNQPFSVLLEGSGEVDAVENSSTDGIVLQQNYPNPFSEETSFEYTTPAEAEVRLTLNDMNGRVLKTITTGKVSEGKHIVNLNLPELPSGTYFLLLESGVTKSMRELTLIK
jgi:hypothetical protein